VHHATRRHHAYVRRRALGNLTTSSGAKYAELPQLVTGRQNNEYIYFVLGWICC
jgi:hypothetical protein